MVTQYISARNLNSDVILNQCVIKCRGWLQNTATCIHLESDIGQTHLATDTSYIYTHPSRPFPPTVVTPLPDPTPRFFF